MCSNNDGGASCSATRPAAPSVVSANDVEALVESYVELVCNDLMTGTCPYVSDHLKP
jgi:hypothetical protein